MDIAGLLMYSELEFSLYFIEGHIWVGKAVIRRKAAYVLWKEVEDVLLIIADYTYVVFCFSNNCSFYGIAGNL